MTVVSETLLVGKAVFRKEAQAVVAAGERLSSSFEHAVDLMGKVTGRVVVSGLGKSGHIARKVASTLSSTGTPAVFLHPSEALHGDFGMFTAGDLLLAIAHGGETREVVAVGEFAVRKKLPVIALTGKSSSSLGRLASCVLDMSVTAEADSLGLAPTASSTVALCCGDALALALMKARRFTEQEFAALHPGGILGRRVSKVKTFMHGEGKFATVLPDESFGQVLKAFTDPNFGIVAVVEEGCQLLGCVSDGDLRRSLATRGPSVYKTSAKDIMTPKPKTVFSDTSVLDAIGLMERAGITSVFVLDRGGGLAGLVRLHDLLDAKIL